MDENRKTKKATCHDCEHCLIIAESRIRCAVNYKEYTSVKVCFAFKAKVAK